MYPTDSSSSLSDTAKRPNKKKNDKSNADMTRNGGSKTKTTIFPPHSPSNNTGKSGGRSHDRRTVNGKSHHKNHKRTARRDAKKNAASSSNSNVAVANDGDIRTTTNESGSGGSGDYTWWRWAEEVERGVGVLAPAVLCDRECALDTVLSDDHARRAPHRYDFAAMHAALIESLLEEQTPPEDRAHGVDAAADPLILLEPAPTSSSPSPPEDSDRTTGSFDSSASCSTVGPLSLPPPSSYLSENCRMQKDKGAGSPAGTACTIFGRDAALSKLRDKTSILGQSRSGDTNFNNNSNNTNSGYNSDYAEIEEMQRKSKKSSYLGLMRPVGKAEMRRGPVKLTQLQPPETRSVLELRMGFISVKYGILLQWNPRTGSVDLIVLRKMVSGAFMDVNSVDVEAYRKRVSNDGKKTSTSKGGSRSHHSKTNGSSHSHKPTNGGGAADSSSSEKRSAPKSSSTTRNRTKKDGGSSITTTILQNDDQIVPDVTTITVNPVDDSALDDTCYAVRNLLRPNSHGRSRGGLVERTSDPPNGLSSSLHPPHAPVPLAPPYRVPRPDRFPDSILSVTVLRARGLVRKRRRRVSTYVRLSTQSDSHETGRVRTTRGRSVWSAHDDNHCALAVDDDDLVCCAAAEEDHIRATPRPLVDDALKVEILDRAAVVGRDRVVSTLYVPLELVEPHRNAGAPPTEVTIPCRMRDDAGVGPYGSVTLSMVYESQRRWWVREEVRRRNQESTSVAAALLSSGDTDGARRPRGVAVEARRDGYEVVEPTTTTSKATTATETEVPDDGTTLTTYWFCTFCCSYDVFAESSQERCPV